MPDPLPPTPPPAGPEAELARLQEALRESEARRRESQLYFEKSFYGNPALMVIANAVDSRIMDVNWAFFRDSGYTREEAVGRSTTELNLWVDPALRDEFISRIRAERSVRDFEAEFRSKSGRITSHILNAYVIELGGAPCMLTVGIDITERRRRDRVQAATYAISQAVLAGGDLPALFAQLHRIVGSLISAKNFYVALLSPDRTTLSFPYFVDETAKAPAPRPAGFSLTDYVINTSRPLRTTADELTVILRGDNRYQPTGKPSALWLGAPLVIDGRAIGVIAVQDYHNPEAYTDADLKLLMFVADQTAAAVHRQQVEAAQRESRAYFEKSFHSSPAIMTITRIADGRIVELNPAACRTSGYTREETLGRTTQELNAWVNAPQRDEFYRRVATGGAVTDMEADFRSKGGKISTVIINGDIIELGGERCLLTVGIDITGRRRRDLVQNATFQISAVLLAGGDLAALFAEVHRIIGSLMAARNFYVALLSADGSRLAFPYFVDAHVPAPPPRELGNGFTEHIAATGRPLLVTAAELSAILAARGSYPRLDRPAAQRLGAPLLIDGRAIGVIALQDYDNAGAYGDDDLRLLTFVAEQTAAAVHRRETEEAARQAARQYRAIFDNALEGLYLTTPDGRFLSVNPALARMCGYNSPQALMVAMNNSGGQLYVRPGRREEFLKLVERTDEIPDFESEIFRADGSKIWVSESVRALRASTGQIDHFEGVAIDITHKHEAARALQEAKEAADAASRAKSYFLASVSHELRTPLNGILGYTQILRRDTALNAKQREGVRVIHESADHLLALINDVLDLSKIEAGRIELHPADFDLPEFVAAVERAFLSRAREKNLALKASAAPGLPRWVRGDEQRLRQIVFNLVGNAVKFTLAGEIVFSVRRAEGELIRFSVSDTGPGIAEADLGKLFQPFTQIGQSAAGGTGLGLAISHSLVERMAGRLHVESKPGWGSRFWFEIALPLASAAVAPVTLRPVVGYEGPPRRVLVVDDNAANRAVLVELLAPLGFELAAAADGAAGLAAAEKFLPDLVLMDLRMPGEIDGLEATRRLRRTPRGAALRIVVVSASAYDLDRSDCFAAGCDDFLAKPFREEELWAAVARALGLVWRHGEPEEEGAAAVAEIYPPPREEAAALHDLAEKGDVMGIRARAAALVRLDPKLEPFARHVLDLAARFKMKAIRQFVARYKS